MPWPPCSPPPNLPGAIFSYRSPIFIEHLCKCTRPCSGQVCSGISTGALKCACCLLLLLPCTAHVDHGKTTLMDRLLAYTGNSLSEDRVMDSNEFERERGARTLLLLCPGVPDAVLVKGGQGVAGILRACLATPSSTRTPCGLACKQAGTLG